MNHSPLYRKMSDRASYAFAQASVAALDVGIVRNATPLPGNAFKIPLARNVIVRTLLELTEEQR
jgi:CO/xanthine dehydrogenase FAD-binding subunit